MSKRLVTFIGLAILALLVLACVPNPQPAGLTPVPTLAPGPTLALVPAIQGAPEAGSGEVEPGQADAAQGAPLYLLHCTPCHGNEGQGIDAPPLRNSQFVQTGGDQNVAATVSDGRPSTEMPAWLMDNGGPLTDVEIGDVVAYLHTMQGVSSDATLAPDAGPPGQAASLTGIADQGQSAFGLHCAFCHGPEGVQGLPNPGSDDGSVPVLNPIDPEIANSDARVFTQNVDGYLEHGSLPEGSGPLLLMPPFGQREMLSQQQIADLIAYVLKLNGVEK
jgi:mono/diheme cytochrome c family protein